MPRRLPYALAALLVIAVAAIVWRVFSTRLPQGSAVIVSQSLAADAAMLSAPPGKWQSDLVKITTRSGDIHEQILQIQFNAAPPSAQGNAPDAQAKLFVSSPTKGIPHLAEVSVSLGDGSFNDVRLSESNGVRTITITRAVDPNDPNPAKKQRIYERFYSLSFRYELKNRILTLKGFPVSKPIGWGVSEFTVPMEDVTFKPVQ
jgi:hypothetical protein